MDDSRVKNERLHTMTVITNATEHLGVLGSERRSEMRSVGTHMRLQRLYGAQELLLELAVFAVMLSMAFVMCLLRQQVSN